MKEIEEMLKVIGYYNDEGMGEFTLPTSGALKEHGWKPVVLLEDAATALHDARTKDLVTAGSEIAGLDAQHAQYAIEAESFIRGIKNFLPVVGYYKDRGFGELTLPTNADIIERGCEPVVMRKDVVELLYHAISIMRGMISEADRETNPFIAAKMFLEKVK